MAISDLAMGIRNARAGYRQTVPLSIRSAIKKTSAGGIYSALRSAGVGKKLIEGASAASPASSTGTVSTGGDYALRAKVNADGSVGYDYFFNGQPITEAEYANAGMNLSGDQELAYEDLIGGYQGSPASYGGGGGTAYSPNFAVIDGALYDLTDPGQLQAYISRADDVLNSDFEYFRSRSENLRDEDISEARAKEERVLDNIARALERVGEQEGRYNVEFDRSVQDLVDGFRQGTARRQSYYASIAPNVYQSSQGSSQEHAENKWKEANKRLDEDKTMAMQGFADTRRDYRQAEQDTRADTNLYEMRRQRQAEDEIATQAKMVQAQRDSALAGAYNYMGEVRGANPVSNKWSGFDFQERNLDYSPSKVNLNDLMNFIKFSPVGAQANAPAYNMYRTSQISTPEAGGASLNQYLYGAQPEEEGTLNRFKTGELSY